MINPEAEAILGGVQRKRMGNKSIAPGGIVLVPTPIMQFLVRVSVCR